MVGRVQDRILEVMAVAALGLVILAASAFIWIGLPVLGFWIAGRLTSTPEAFLLFVLSAVPLTMVGFGWLLYRVNALYERLRGGGPSAGGSRSAWLVSSSDERARLRRAGAPRSLIDVAMAVSAIVALVLMFVYFFFVGEMRLVNPL
jgi:hypothetical protein